MESHALNYDSMDEESNTNNNSLITRPISPRHRSSEKKHSHSPEDEKDRTRRSAKRRRSPSNSDISSDCECSPKPSNRARMPSVLVQPKPYRDKTSEDSKRQAILDSQRNDKRALDRNKRMFGMLLGTLRQFKAEETTRETSTTKKLVDVDKKLELTSDVCPSHSNISYDLPSRQPASPKPSPDPSDPATIEQDITQRFKNWESANRPLTGYIKTEAKPKIFWLPKEHNSITEKKLKETKDYHLLVVAERIASHQKELRELRERSEHIRDETEPPVKLTRSTLARSESPSADAPSEKPEH